jgi:hypothetical protein
LGIRPSSFNYRFLHSHHVHQNSTFLFSIDPSTSFSTTLLLKFSLTIWSPCSHPQNCQLILPKQKQPSTFLTSASSSSFLQLSYSSSFPVTDLASVPHNCGAALVPSPPPSFSCKPIRKQTGSYLPCIPCTIRENPLI